MVRSLILGSLVLVGIACSQEFDHHLTVVVTRSLGRVVTIVSCKSGQTAADCDSKNQGSTLQDQDSGRFYLSGIPADATFVRLLISQQSPAQCAAIDVNLAGFPAIEVQVTSGDTLVIKCDPAKACAETPLSALCL